MVAKQGTKQVGAITSARRKRLATVAVTISKTNYKTTNLYLII